ncbi:hypothetical protein [Paracraurococcus lichenis]|uniref:Lipoprotein n=1 Tax=Paracraurococcus lichenis TaxID=3064888 RepID=A0ABT9DTT5_9PROT|nr:hypothetical protein [Paracraurococcus sp. LOR1-02]MDO9707293.1 hypothetical protein [Paracraurococcus sp. LOR1-02]
MRRGILLGMAAGALALAGCAAPQPATPLPDPAVVAMHEWDHGAPWGPEEQPWVAPPQVLAAGPGFWGPDYWGPGYWGPSVGLGLGFGVYRGHWWRGHRGYYGGHFGGWRGGHFHGGGRRGRR